MVYLTTQNVGWMGDIRVDDIAYIFQGGRSNLSHTIATTVGAYITPTRSIFTIDAGPVRLNLTYLTPIEVRFSCFAQDNHLDIIKVKRLDAPIFPLRLLRCQSMVNGWEESYRPTLLRCNRR